MKASQPNLVDVIIAPMDTSIELIKRIHEVKGLPKLQIQNALRYNVLPVKTLCILTGMSRSTIEVMFRGRIRENSIYYELSFCYPFDLGPEKSHKYIYRDEKFEALMKRIYFPENVN